MQIDDFNVIVFDECHHATGEHNYSKILDSIRSVPASRRPRVLGLTASPIRVDNLVKGRNKLQKFQRQFLGSSIFYPETEKLTTAAEQVTFRRSVDQDRFIAEAIELIERKGKSINKMVAGYTISSTASEVSTLRSSRYKNLLRNPVEIAWLQLSIG